MKIIFKTTLLIFAILFFTFYLLPDLTNNFICVKNGLIATPSIYGQYGDFIGGILNPFFALLNIIALVYLTYTVSHVEDKRAKENIHAQKIITLNQMRYNTVSELSKSLYPITQIIKHEDKISIISSIISLMEAFKDSNYYLFKKLYVEKYFDEKYYVPFFMATSNLYELYSKNEIVENRQEIFSAYENSKNEFLKTLNKFTIDELSSEESKN